MWFATCMEARVFLTDCSWLMIQVSRYAHGGAHRESKAADWEMTIHVPREDAMGVFTDGSLNEERNVGGGRYVGGVGGGKEGMATVWNGEVVGVRGGLTLHRKTGKSSDSQAAISGIHEPERPGRGSWWK